jgi:hypothetical protein
MYIKKIMRVNMNNIILLGLTNREGEKRKSIIELLASIDKFFKSIPFQLLECYGVLQLES